MSNATKKGKGRSLDDTMDDDSDDKHTKRKTRNLSEKRRRDQFNVLVNELRSMIPSGSRKMDKSSVLKSTIAFLKNHNEMAMRSRAHEIQEDWKPSFLTNEEFTHLVLEAVDGFLMVFSTSGQILYVSESITSFLDHLPSEVLKMTIYEMTPEEEQGSLYNTLLGVVEDDAQISFSCHLRRGGSSLKQNAYFELVNFLGYFRSDADMVHDDDEYRGYSGEADTRLVFVGTGRLQRPQLIREMSLLDALKCDFTSRHSLEWKFLFLDHRGPPIIGYLPFELLGTSGYDYYHVDDLDNVVESHKALMEKGEGTSCYYRFLAKGQQWIWLQTRSYITYHQWNSKPEFIVCTHRVISYAEVLKYNRKDQEDARLSVVEESSQSYNSSVSPSWSSQASKGRIVQEAGLESASTSNDLPNFMLSGMNLLSTRSGDSQEKTILVANVPSQQQYMEPRQFVPAIPTQSVGIGFSAPSDSTPLQPVKMAYDQTTLHADLQRKHAELQASIGQQQAQLKVVSEQLLMARLGLLPQTPQTTPYASGTVSSTTVTMSTPSDSMASPAAPSDLLQQLVATSPILNAPVAQHQPNAQYSPPDSNTSPQLAELK